MARLGCIASDRDRYPMQASAIRASDYVACSVLRVRCVCRYPLSFLYFYHREHNFLGFLNNWIIPDGNATSQQSFESYITWPN
jgi:hypothetical protein